MWVSSICDSQYFKNVFIDLIPTMTSDTVPYGEVFSSKTYTTDLAYYAFDKNDDSYVQLDTETSENYIGYKFKTKPKSVIRFSRITQNILQYPNTNNPYGNMCSSFVLQGSDDGSNWNTIHEVQNNSDLIYEHNLPKTSYLYYRIYRLRHENNTAPNPYYSGVNEIKLYGRL